MELKKCPFCGSEAENIDGNEGEYFIGCLNECCEVYCCHDNPTAWNHRPTEDTLQAELDTKHNYIKVLQKENDDQAAEIKRLEKSLEAIIKANNRYQSGSVSLIAKQTLKGGNDAK